MVTKEKRIEKICSFYASDYHLEMIMIPYINKKIETNANIAIITERDLTETLETVISRINLPQERKQEIIDLNWKNSGIKNIKQTNSNQELIIFVIGSVDYINKINNQLEEIGGNYSTKIVNCYSIEEVQKNITDIVLSHSKVLNTTEEKEIE